MERHSAYPLCFPYVGLSKYRSNRIWSKVLAIKMLLGFNLKRQRLSGSGVTVGPSAIVHWQIESLFRDHSLCVQKGLKTTLWKSRENCFNEIVVVFRRISGLFKSIQVLNFSPNSLLVLRDSTFINIVDFFHTLEPLSKTTQHPQPTQSMPCHPRWLR